MSLKGQVAIVAGATRGAGRGIAAALGEKGATVYCTGRSIAGKSAMAGRPECIEDTAKLVASLGGNGIAVQTDHLYPSQIKALVDRVMEEQGRIDILVNDIWGGDPLTQWGKPFWELDHSQGFKLLQTAIYTHIMTAQAVAPHMVAAKRGLIVELTDGDHWAYRGNLFYDLAKTSVARLAFDMNEELQPESVTAVAVTPGFLRSEAVLEHFGVGEHDWKAAGATDPDFMESETPRFVGRCIAALAADAWAHEKGGKLLSSWNLAKEYGLDDVDGRRPDWGHHFSQKYGSPPRPVDDGFFHYWEGYGRLREILG